MFPKHDRTTALVADVDVLNSVRCNCATATSVRANVRTGKHCSAAKDYRRSLVHWQDAYTQDRDNEQFREALKRVKRKYDQSKERCDAKG